MRLINYRSNKLIVLMPFLQACGGGLITTVGPDYQAPEPPSTQQWQTPVPETTLAHGGDPEALKHWWQGFNDPVLYRFLQLAQQQSANVAEAASHIQEARSSVMTAFSAGLPVIDGNLASSRSSFSFGGPPFLRDQHQVGLQASWEVDLFGSVSRQREAAESQLESKVASWHDARVAVAVEVANAYLGFRQCEVLVKLAEADAISRQESDRLTRLAGQAGLRGRTDVVLAQASAADGQDSLLKQQGQCELDIKGLVALTGLPEAEVRRELNAVPEQTARLPSPPPFGLDALPAKVLMQRPDVAAAERNAAQASAKIGVEQANRFPKLSLSGNITPSLQSMNGAALALAQTWSFGPTLSLPVFDAGKRAAAVEAAEAVYEASISRFRSTVRTAAKEVEEALTRLRTAEQRLPQARAAANGYDAHFKASDQLYRAGFGTLLDAETSRRQKLVADRTLAELENERAAAWIALYRAAGGGWEDTVSGQASTATSPTDKSQDDPS